MTQKIINVLCVNCGKVMAVPENRFPICSCGHTVPIVGDAPFAECIFNSTEEIMCIRIHSGENTNVIPFSEEHISTLISALPNLKMKNEDDVKTQIFHNLGSGNLSKAIISQIKELYTATDIILHIIYCKHSSVYRTLFFKGYYEITKALLYGKKLLNFNDDKQVIHVSDIKEYIDGSYQNIVSSVECYLAGLSKEMKDIIVNADVTLAEYQYLLKNTRFNEGELLKYLGELQSVEITGSEAITNIIDYDHYICELEKWIDVNYDENAPIYTNLHFLKTTYNMYYRKGLIAMFQYENQYKDDHFENYLIDDYEIKMLNGKEVNKLPLNTLPITGVTSPLIGVFNHDGHLLSLICNNNGSIMIKGEQKDEVKKAVNKYLDCIEKGGMAD